MLAAWKGGKLGQLWGFGCFDGRGSLRGLLGSARMFLVLGCPFGSVNRLHPLGGYWPTSCPLLRSELTGSIHLAMMTMMALPLTPSWMPTLHMRLGRSSDKRPDDLNKSFRSVG